MQTLERPSLLIDHYLPDFDTTRREHLVVHGDPVSVYEVVRDMDLLSIHSPMLDALMWLRSVPGKITGRELPTPPTMRLGDLFDEPTAPTEDQPWVALAEERGHEILFGVVGRFWQPDITWNPVPSDRFAAFDEPDWGKIAAAISVVPYGTGRTLVSYEARTELTDAAARRKFRRYWTLVSPFVGFVMRTLLTDLGRRMETT